MWSRGRAKRALKQVWGDDFMERGGSGRRGRLQGRFGLGGACGVANSLALTHLLSIVMYIVKQIWPGEGRRGLWQNRSCSSICFYCVHLDFT